MLSLLSKRRWSALFLSGLLTLIGSAKAADTNSTELIVKFRADATDAQIAHGIEHGHLKVKRHLQTHPMRERNHAGISLVETDLTRDEAIARLKNHPAV